MKMFLPLPFTNGDIQLLLTEEQLDKHLLWRCHFVRTAGGQYFDSQHHQRVFFS